MMMFYQQNKQLKIGKFQQQNLRFVQLRKKEAIPSEAISLILVGKSVS